VFCVALHYRITSLGEKIGRSIHILIFSYLRIIMLQVCRVIVMLITIIACANLLLRVLLWEYSLFTRVGPFLRITLFMVSNRVVRSTFRKVCMVLREVHNVLSLVVIFIVFFGWLGTILFQDTVEGNTNEQNVH